MNVWIASLAAIGLSYLLGSLSFAVIVSKVMGLSDPRTYGSRNPGATNVLRSGNKAAALVTLVLDAVKGWAAVYFTAAFAPVFGYGLGVIALAGLAAFVGHLWPVFFRFQGGKGVATAFGVLLALNVWMGLAAAASWAIIAAFFRYSSLASMVAAVFAVFYWLFNFGADIAAPVILVMAGLVIYRHRQNIDNLLAGKERKLGEKAKA
jgi:glycerol-3-phosphate acyltransferase PlsY